MPTSRKDIPAITEKRSRAMSAAAQMLSAIDAEIYKIVDALPDKVLARIVNIKPRYLRAIKYREQPPNAEARAEFGFACPSVGAVHAYWAQRMTQPDFFEPETQAAFWRDYNRAGKS